MSSNACLSRALVLATMVAFALLPKLVTAQGAQSPLRLPLSGQGDWQMLQFRNLPPHRVGFSASGMEIRVDGSAMPLIYPLPKAMRVKDIVVRGRFAGTLRVPPDRQGEKHFDDYVFRIGLVVPGERTLNAFERQLAAAWVRKLFDLAPKGSGISRIHFFNVGTHGTQIGRQRQHPLSDLILEKVVAVPRADGRFDFVHTLAEPLDTIAVWLSSDGDDTGSRFTVFVEEIELRPAAVSSPAWKPSN